MGLTAAALHLHLQQPQPGSQCLGSILPACAATSACSCTTLSRCTDICFECPLYCFCVQIVCAQLVEIMPCLDKLPQLLGTPYGQEDEDAGQQAGVEDMDTDGPGAAGAGPGSRRQQGGMTLEELLQRVQVGKQCQRAAVLLLLLWKSKCEQQGPRAHRTAHTHAPMLFMVCAPHCSCGMLLHHQPIHGRGHFLSHAERMKRTLACICCRQAALSCWQSYSGCKLCSWGPTGGWWTQHTWGLCWRCCLSGTA